MRQETEAKRVEQLVTRVLGGRIDSQLVLLDLPAMRREGILETLRALDRPVLSTPGACG